MYFNDDNNYFELDNNNFIDFNFNNYDFDRNNSSFSLLEEGFNNGNLFKNTYSKYKNHNYKIKVNNEKDKLLYKIQVYNFALHDIALYLDVYPNNKDKLKEYLSYKKEFIKLKDEYVNKYGALCKMDVSNVNRWTWCDNPWPWDNKMGGNINV